MGDRMDRKHHFRVTCVSPHREYEPGGRIPAPSSPVVYDVVAGTFDDAVSAVRGRLKGSEIVEVKLMGQIDIVV